MEHLARLLPFRRFGRLRGLRRRMSHPVYAAIPSMPPSALPAFARVSLNTALNHAAPSRGAPVRIYDHGPSRVILVGTIDAVCRMIDRCVAEKRPAA